VTGTEGSSLSRFGLLVGLAIEADDADLSELAVGRRSIAFMRSSLLGVCMIVWEDSDLFKAERLPIVADLVMPRGVSRFCLDGDRVSVGIWVA